VAVTVRRAWLAIAIVALVLPARAADEAEEPQEWLGVASGGLAIEEVPGLQLASVAVALSPEHIEASYVVLNTGETPSFVEVGFPIPSVAHPPTDSTSLAHAFSDATLQQDGVPLDLHEVRIRVFMRGVDVTDVLASAGLDLKPLAAGDPAAQPRERRRAMEQVLIDSGIAVDPTGWSLAVEPVWRVEIAERVMTTLTLSYTPFPGHSVDQLPGDEKLEDLAHLSAYCADEQTGLLSWVLGRWQERSESKRKELIVKGESEEDAALDAYANIDLIDLSFRWQTGVWPAVYPKVELTVDPGQGRAAFCTPPVGDDAPPPATLGAGGTYTVELQDLPAAGQIDVMFLR
jgi:hypothetical protein